MAPFLTSAAIFYCLALSTVLCQVDICYEKADILFIMDASGSIGPESFQKQLQFAATLVNSFEVPITQFAVLAFDTTARIVIDFDDYKDNIALKNAILKIPYTGGGTNTGDALQLARVSAFTANRGARSGVPKIAIVSTDGQSNSPNETVIEAQALKNSNVLVLSIGVGQGVIRNELNAIATFPEDVFEVVDYSQLVSIVYDYSELVCREVKLFNCNNKADVFFLLDTSSSIPLNLYQNEVHFVANFTSSESTDVIIGAAIFGGSAFQKLISLGQIGNLLQISQVLQSAQLLGGSTDTNSALTSVITQKVFDPASGGRPDATKILIILTNGGSVTQAQAKLTATQLRATGVNIIAVGVSRPNIAELKELVSHPVYDVITNLATPKVAIDRVEELTASRECTLPQIALRNVSDICRQLNWENGIHPHPYNCSRFIQCTFLKTDELSCPEKEVYDPDLKTCNYPGFVHTPCYIIGISNTTPRPPVTSAPTTAKPCITGTLDVLLLFDSSDGIGRTEFGKELRLAANLAEYFNISSEYVQFGATSFGTNPKHLFNFNDFTEYKPLQYSILNATYQGGSSNTFLALEDAATFFSATHGSRDVAPKLAILFTSGRSSDNNRTQQAAAALKSAGVRIIAVGFSNPDLQQLQTIASSPGQAFDGSNFNGILSAIKTYSNSTCAGEKPICHGIQFADVIFVLDSSKSIEDKDYTDQLQFVADVTSSFTLGPEDIRFGAVIFSQDTRKLFDLKDFGSKDTLRSAILSAPHLKSGTDTAGALNYVREQHMFSSGAGGRDNATKIVVILTDGRSNSINETVEAANRLKITGVKFIVVGIGDEIFLEELWDLASENQSLFLVPGFAALDEIRASVTRLVCDLPKTPQNDYSYLCASFSWADGRHPNPYDCSTYVICYSYSTTLQSCRSGEAYDPIKEICTDKKTAHRCDDPLYYGPTVTVPPQVVKTSEAPVLVDISNLCKVHRLVDGIYPDPSSCSHFVECTNTLTQRLECPEGLHFNTVNSVCDDVHIVDCQVNYHYYNIPIIG